MKLFRLAPATDQALVEACLASDRKAQKQFYDRFASKMFTVTLRYCATRPDAEDCLLVGFEKAFAQLSSYQHLGSLEGWVRRIMVREALMQVRKRSLMFVETTEAIEDSTGAWPTWLQHLEAEELMTYVRRLPDGYRIVFNLYAIEGFAHDEIAEQLGISAATSRSQLARARAQLQKWIADETKIAQLKDKNQKDK